MVSYLSTSRWDVLSCGDVQGDLCCCNRLIFLDLVAISHHIAFFYLVTYVRKSYFCGAGALFFYGSIVNTCRCSIVTVNGVGGCGGPSSTNFILKVRSSFIFIKSALKSASDADDAIQF